MTRASDVSAVLPLSEGQYQALRYIKERPGGAYPGCANGNASRFGALVRRGLVERLGKYGPYNITAVGMAVLRDLESTR